MQFTLVILSIICASVSFFIVRKYEVVSIFKIFLWTIGGAFAPLLLWISIFVYQILFLGIH